MARNNKVKKVNKNLIRNILIWIVVALIIQNGIFYYFNKRFGASITVKAVKVNENVDKKKDQKVKLSSDAKDVKFSYNGQYISYMQNDKLKFYDLRKNETKEIEAEKGAKIEFGKWVAKKTAFILIERNNNQFRFYAYDANKNIKNELVDFDMNKSRIDIKDDNDKVEDIVASDTNVMYIKVARGYAVYDIYRCNVMNQLNLIREHAVVKGQIAIPYNDTRLVYKEFDNIKIRKDSDKRINIHNSKNTEIAGIDKENNLYLQVFNENGEIKTILYGNVNEDPSTYKSVELSRAAQKSEIIVQADGKLYFNNSLEGKIIDLKSNAETEYDGKLLGIYKDGLASSVDDEVKFKTLN